MSAFEVIGGIGLLAIIGWACQFYWFRVVGGGLLLTIWGLISIVTPVWLAIQRLSEGELFAALLTVACGVFLSMFWYIGANAAYQWYQRQAKYGGGFWKPFNEG